MRACDRTCVCGNSGAKRVRRPLKIVRAKCVRVGFLRGVGALQNILQKLNERLSKPFIEIQLVSYKILNHLTSSIPEI